MQATVLEDHRAWVAYEVGHALWGQGLAAEATRAMIEHLTSCYAVTQCLATVDQRNARSWRLLQRHAPATLTAGGGGETAAVIAQAGVTAHITHISTGGGASLEMLEGKTLPAFEILSRRAKTA